MLQLHNVERMSNKMHVVTIFRLRGQTIAIAIGCFLTGFCSQWQCFLHQPPPPKFAVLDCVLSNLFASNCFAEGLLSPEIPETEHYKNASLVIFLVICRVVEYIILQTGGAQIVC